MPLQAAWVRQLPLQHRRRDATAALCSSSQRATPVVALGGRGSLVHAAMRSPASCPAAPAHGAARRRAALRPPAAFNSGSGLGSLDPVKALQKELGIQSTRLNPTVKQLVESAIESLGYRVTVGDVAARAGVSIAQADEALKALAYDSLAALEVSREGEVVYAFERGFKATISNRSLVQRLAPLWGKAKAVANYLARIAFGVALFASVLLVWVAVAALLSSRDSNDNRRGRGGFGGGFGGGVWIDPLDFLWYWQPGYQRRVRSKAESGEGMSFLEAVFSFVFGEGDPNEGWQERRFRALGEHIQRLGGVVTAEEMAPFLDPPRLGRRLRAGPNKYEDESFVLPALIRFGGEPFVGEDGTLLYRFDALRTSATELRRQPLTVRVPQEREYVFSEASGGQQAGALALGVLNVVGVLTLSTLLADPVAKYALLKQGLGFIVALMPALQAYATAFFAVPFFRSLVNGRRNGEITQRNEARLQAVSLLQSGDADLKGKEAAARKLGGRRVIGPSEIVYATDTDVDPQANAMQEDEFDAKLGVRGGARRGEVEGRRRSPQEGGRRFDDVFERRGDAQRVQRGQQRGPFDGW